MKAHPDLFRVLKTKAIAQVRVTSHDISAVTNWFAEYLAWCTQHNIQPQDIYNFDETGFRVGVAPGQEVVVPAYITEMYVPMAENRKSVTVIESICAIGKEYPPVIIVQGHQHMESWYHEKLNGDELVLLSDSGYTNSELAMIFLEHFIKHTDAGPNKPMKVFLMDSHISHIQLQSFSYGLCYDIKCALQLEWGFRGVGSFPGLERSFQLWSEFSELVSLKRIHSTTT